MVTNWWFAGPGTWHRNFGKFSLEAKKVGTGYYLAVVTSREAGKVYEAPAGTLRGAKAAADRWASDHH